MPQEDYFTDNPAHVSTRGIWPWLYRFIFDVDEPNPLYKTWKFADECGYRHGLIGASDTKAKLCMWERCKADVPMHSIFEHVTHSLDRQRKTAVTFSVSNGCSFCVSVRSSPAYSTLTSAAQGVSASDARMERPTVRLRKWAVA